MKLWTTEIKALDPHTGEMKTWIGDVVKAPTWEAAQAWCDANKGYLRVIGELVAEVDLTTDKHIDYDTARNN